MKRFEPIDPKTIKESTTKIFNDLGKEIVNISFLGRGEASAVFKISTDTSAYALKTALYPERKQKILNEAKIRTNFIKNGVQCVPAPIYVDKEFFKNGAVVFDYAEGEHSDYQDISTIKKIAQNLAQIHNVDFKIVPDGLKQIENNHKFLKKIIKHMETDYPHLVNPPISKAFSLALDEYDDMIQENSGLFQYGISGTLHGDLGGHFITDSQGKVWLVDWENSEYGDMVEEVCTFLFYSDISEELKKIFLKEYKKNFPPSKELDYEKIGYYYNCVMPVFNVCWGLDQLHTNLIYKLEPERKILDVNKSAKNWKKYFSEEPSDLILEGVNELTLKLVNEYNLCL